MNLIEAMIAPQDLETVKEALAAVQVEGLTVVDVQGMRRQQAAGDEQKIQRKLKVMIAINDELLQTALEALRESRGAESQRTGGIYVTPLADAVRIRTGERGAEAL